MYHDGLRASSSYFGSVLCLLTLWIGSIDAALFQKVQELTTTTLTETFISSYSNGNYIINAADSLNVYAVSAKQKSTFAIPSTKILASQDKTLTVFTAAAALNSFTFLIKDSYSYSELVNITGATEFKHFFNDHLVYKTSDPNQYSVYNLVSKQSRRLDLTSIPNFPSFVCGEVLTNFVLCLQPGTVVGYLLDLENLTVKKQNFSMMIRDEAANYQTIYQLIGYDKILVVLGERLIASVTVVAADAYYITEDKNLTYLSSIRSGFASSTLACPTGVKTLVFNPIMGFLLRFCKGSAEVPLLYNSRESIFVQITESYWGAGDTIEQILTNKYDGSLTIQSSGTTKKGVTLYQYVETSTPAYNSTCLSYSRVLSMCLRCASGFLLNSSGTTLSCVVNQSYVDSSKFNIELQKSTLVITLNSPSVTGVELTTKLKAMLEPNGANLEFYGPSGELLDQNQYFSLDLILEKFDQEKNVIRYRLTNTASHPQLVLKVKFKLSNSLEIFPSKTVSARVLATPSFTKELLIQAYAHSTFDSNTLFLSLYLILCFSCQIFLVFIRPFKEVLRDNIKTFWVASAVMQIQMLSLLGCIGGKFRGPMDRVLSSSFKAMVKYLVFDAEVDFDGRFNEYVLLSPYQDLTYAWASPFLLQSRYIWVALYAVVFALSTIGTRNFRNILYHMRIGILFSWGVQFVFFSVSTIYAVAQMKIYTSMPVFSLIFSLLGLIFIVAEITFLKFTDYPNRKFMLSFDSSKPMIDAFTIETPQVLRMYHDPIFCLLSAFLIALIPNRVAVLLRALIGLAIVYILSVVVQIRDHRLTPYIISYYAKIAWASMFIFMLVLLIELDVNTGLGVMGINGIGYLSMIIFIACFVLPFAVMLYRWFTPEKETDNSKPEITYKTNYAVRRYSKNSADNRESGKSQVRTQGNEDSMNKEFRKDERKTSLLDMLQSGTPTPMRDNRFFPRSPNGEPDNLAQLKLSEISHIQRQEGGNSSRQNSERQSSHVLAPPSPSRLLDKFAVKEDEKDKITNRTTDRNKDSSNTIGKNLFQIKESRIEEASQLGDISSDINLDINDPSHGIKELMGMSNRKVVRHSQLDNQMPSPGKMDELAYTSQTTLRPPLQPKNFDDEDPNLRIPAEADA